jgi:F-type H+-transporting ATPase subunit alpha
MVEVLKQGRFEPMPVEDQVIEIFAGTQGFLDDIPVEHVRTFLADLCDYVKSEHPEVPQAIRAEKVLDDRHEKTLRDDIAAFHKTVAPDEPGETGVA